MIFFKNSRFHNFRERAQDRNLGGPPSKAKLAHLCVPSCGVVAQLLGQPVHSSTQLRRRLRFGAVVFVDRCNYPMRGPKNLGLLRVTRLPSDRGPGPSFDTLGMPMPTTVTITRVSVVLRIPEFCQASSLFTAN